jgi:hypothetical protein
MPATGGKKRRTERFNVRLSEREARLIRLGAEQRGVNITRLKKHLLGSPKGWPDIPSRSSYWQGSPLIEARAGLDSAKRYCKDALLRIAHAADIVGARTVPVDAIDERAREFYEHFDFEPSPIHELQWMLLMKDLRKAHEESTERVGFRPCKSERKRERRGVAAPPQLPYYAACIVLFARSSMSLGATSSI